MVALVHHTFQFLLLLPYKALQYNMILFLFTLVYSELLLLATKKKS